MDVSQLTQVALPYLEEPAWWATLENGHQILVVRKPGEVVHLHTLVRTGSINETDANTGVSHFLEHLMFKGTARYPVGAFDRIMEGIGARINASTSKDFTQYFATLPRGLDDEYYRLALDLHADMLLHAALPEEEIGLPFDPEQPGDTEKRERMVVIEEIKMGRDNPWRRTMQTVTELLYPTHPYRREIIGTAEVIATIPRAAIEDYYRTWYQPANMVTLLVGEFDPQAAIADIARQFDFHATQPVEHLAFAQEQPPETPRVERIELPVNVGYVLLGYLGPDSVDLHASIALDVLALILGDGKSSRMQLRLVEGTPDTPFIDVGTAHLTYRDNSNILCYGIVRPDALESAFELLRAEVDKLPIEPPTPAELEKAVTRLETQFAAQAETASGIAYALADSMARLNNPSAYTDYVSVLRSLTIDDLVRYAAQYLRAEQLCAVLVNGKMTE